MSSPSQSRTAPRRSPVVAFLLSLIPGMGQIYAGKTGRGLGVLLFVVTLVPLALWRMVVGGVNYSGPIAQAPTDAQVRAAWGLGIFLLVCTLLVYLWSLWDAQRCVRGRPLPAVRIIVLATLAFFVVGWDITEIDLQKMVTRFPEVLPRLAQIAWPWDNAFVQGVEQTQAFAYIDVPCGTTPPPAADQPPSGPSITVTPACGDMAGPIQPNGERNPPGTVLHVTGSNFRPNEEATVWWEPTDSAEFRPRAGGFIVVDPDAAGNFTLDVTIPSFTIANGLTASRSKIILRQEQKAGPLQPSQNLQLALSKMVETIFLGLMATLFGMIVSFPLSFLAARNLMSGNRYTLIVYTIVRAVFNIIRSIEPLIWAVILIAWVGLGPFAGTLALALHTLASLGKLYSEAIESIDEGPLEAIQATGANWLQVIIYGVIPQIVPSFVSFTVYRWDINIRASTIIGAVGGGGIGALLIQWIRLSDYDSAGIAVWLIAIVVTILDYSSTQIRERFV